MRRFCALVGLLFVAGCSTAPRVEEPPVLARFFLESPDESGPSLLLPQSETKIFTAPKPILTEYDFAKIEIAQVELGRCLLFQLTPAAARDLHRLSGSQLGQRLVLTLDGRAMGARRIDRPIADGAVYIFIETPDDDLPALREQLAKTTTELQRVARKL